MLRRLVIVQFTSVLPTYFSTVECSFGPLEGRSRTSVLHTLGTTRVSRFQEGGQERSRIRRYSVIRTYLHYRCRTTRYPLSPYWIRTGVTRSWSGRYGGVSEGPDPSNTRPIVSTLLVKVERLLSHGTPGLSWVHDSGSSLLVVNPKQGVWRGLYS